MTKMSAAAYLSAVLFASAATPLAAETSAAPAPAVPGGSGGDEAKAGGTLLDRQRNNAAKLAGMVRFVVASCPQAKPDYDRFKQVVAALGIDLKDLETGELMGRSISYAQAYQKDTAASCEKALALFGESGTAVPGLIARKTP